MPALALNDAIQIVGIIVILTGVVWSQRMSTAKLELKQGEMQRQLQVGQEELLRQVSAVHKRLDDYGKRLGRTETHQAVLEERVRNLKDTQRFRIVEANEPSSFKVEDGE